MHAFAIYARALALILLTPMRYAVLALFLYDDLNEITMVFAIVNGRATICVITFRLLASSERLRLVNNMCISLHHTLGIRVCFAESNLQFCIMCRMLQLH